jgi:CheY-like chemotaxis protein
MGPTSRRVLLVEDDPDIRHVLADLLGRNGYEVAAASDGRLALEYLDYHEPPRLVLLDLMMPGRDGWEFLQARRHRPDLLDVPVVVFSAVADVGGPNPLPLGAAKVLRKPVGLAVDLDAVRRYCGAPAGPDVP